MQFNVHAEPNCLVTAPSAQVAGIATMCVQSEAGFRPLMTDHVQVTVKATTLSL
jgi:hypothetical protein